MRAMHVVVWVTPLVGAASWSFAGPVFLTTTEDKAGFAYTSAERIEARFKADTTNWDSRLEYDGSPSPGDNQSHLGNGRAFFENRSFGFELAYSAAAAEVAWTLTSSNAVSNTLALSTAGLTAKNALQLYSSGSRGVVSVTSLAFGGAGEAVSAFPSLSTSPTGPRFAETVLFFGNDANLFSAGDWSLTGTVSFAGFTKNNPGEGAKFVAVIRDGAVIPTPGAVASIALFGVVASSRRRPRAG